jgi:hypothetical protein
MALGEPETARQHALEAIHINRQLGVAPELARLSANLQPHAEALSLTANELATLGVS